MKNHRTLPTVIRLSFAATVCLLALAPNPAQSQGGCVAGPGSCFTIQRKC